MEGVRSSIRLISTSRPAARRAVARTAAARSGCRVRPVDPGNVLPQPLEVVELPSLLLEDVDHDVAVVDQDPLPVGHALDALGLRSARHTDLVLHLVTDRLDLAVVGRAGDDEPLAEREHLPPRSEEHTSGLQSLMRT